MIILRELKENEKYVLYDHLNNHEPCDLISDNADEALEEALNISSYSVGIEKMNEEE